MIDVEGPRLHRQVDLGYIRETARVRQREPERESLQSIQPWLLLQFLPEFPTCLPSVMNCDMKV